MPTRRQRPRRPRKSANARNSKKSSGNATDMRAVTSCVDSNALEANGKTVVGHKLRSAMASSKHQDHQEVEVLDNWEDIEDSDVLERKFRNLNPPSQSKCNGMNGQFNIILTGDDALRSQYVPPEPTVTILKRPTKQGHSVNENKVVQPKKTLKQREQEYAEARLRILGEAASPERPEDSNRYASIQHKGGRHAPAGKGQPHQPPPPPPAQPRDDNVIRLPKGPDGSKGFEKR